MENNFIESRKKREFGDVFNDTFIFLKQEAKPLFTALAIFALPLLIISSIGMAYIQPQQLKTFGTTVNFDWWGYLSKLGIIMIFVILGQNMLMVTQYSYIKLYIKKGTGNFDNSELFQEVSRNFLPCLFAVILVFIVMMVGLVMCILPGIYLGVSLALILPIMIMENKPIGSSFTRSFELTHKQWWWTLLIIFVIVILVYVASIILSLPAIIFGIGNLFRLKDPSTAFEYPTYLLIYNSFISLVQSFLYIILHVAIIFQYFNIVEINEGNSLSIKIDQIAQDDQI